MITITKIHRQMEPDHFEFKSKNWIKNAWEVDCTENGKPIANAIIVMNSEDKWAEKNARDIVVGCSFDAERKDDKYNENVFKKKGKVTPPGHAPAPSAPSGGYSAPSGGGYSAPTSAKTFAQMAAEYNGCLVKAKQLAKGLGITDDQAIVAMGATLFIRCEHERITPDVTLADSLKQDGPEPVYAPPANVVDEEEPF